MRQILALLCLSCVALAQTAASSPAGKWISNLQFFDRDNYQRMELTVDGTKLTGKLGRDPINGNFQNGRIEGTVNPNPNTTIHLDGRFEGDRIVGTAKTTEDDESAELKWEATREVTRATSPRTHTFEPTHFEHFFSAAIEPALRVSPSDTVKTWSVDAGGTDSKGVRRTSGGNPLTGPFFIEGAMPGDTLIVHFNVLRLNRDSAISSPLIANSALNPGYVEQRKRVENYNANWKLDRQAGFASLEKPTDAMKNYRVPLAPMLGCV